jgi:aflatoxin B1 aldehyde reductase
VYPVAGYEHNAEGIRKALTDSLAALQVKKVDIYYLHAPDRKVPFVDTCRAMNELHKEGKNIYYNRQF